MGHSRNNPHFPTEEIFVWRVRGEKFVSGKSKCIRISEGAGGVNYQFSL
jgi:hypothetical protein